MTQTRLGSLIEACINVAIGFWINFAANMLILPLFGWQVTVTQNLALGAIYTDITLDRIELVSRAELMRRNSVHRYGIEISRLAQLKGAIQRQINRRTRAAEENAK